jgi:hypothetical protein
LSRFDCVRRSAPAVADVGAAGTSLIAVEAAKPEAAAPVARPRPQAAFLAHLLAVAQRAPQTQDKRRATPQDAIGRYAAAGRPAPVRPGRALKRAV